MPSMESMHKRIHAAEDLYSVVRMMKALAAVSIRQYETAVESLAEYNRTLEMGLQAVLRDHPEIAASQFLSRDRLGVIVFGSDQGMCGSFNEQIAAYTWERINASGSGPSARIVLALGNRVADRLEDLGQPIAHRYQLPNSVPGITPVVDSVLVAVEEICSRQEVDRVLLFHHRSMAASTSRPREQQLLPVDRDWLESLRERRWPTRALPLCSLDRGQMLSMLLRQHFFGSLYRACAESLACENASRLVSMQAAEKNINDHLTSLRMLYQQHRQQSITEELLDIVAGFETLSKEEVKHTWSCPGH